MKVVIIEDEQLAADRLIKIVLDIDPTIEVVAQVDTIRDAADLLSRELATIDLIFCDIHLADGLSFEIFKKVEVTKPVIFTTAYDEYSLDAFKVHSVDYLLKPIQPEAVKAALDKFEKYYDSSAALSTKAIKDLITQNRGRIEKRFLVKSGIKLIPKKMEEIALVYIDNKVVHAVDYPEGKSYLFDYTLDELMNEELEPTHFFRINRKQIVNIDAIESIKPHYNQRLSLSLKFPVKMDLIVSREKVNEFKKWFTR